MKRILFFFTFLLPIICFSQSYQYIGTTNNIVKARGGLMGDSAMYLPIFSTLADTAGLTTYDRLGDMIFIRNISTIYFRDTLAGGGHKWSYLLKYGYGINSLVSDIPTLPQIKTYTPATGLNASANYSASYNFASVDSARYYYTTSGTGTENGGWLAAGTSGDSIQVLAPFGIIIGDSQAEGKPGLFGRLDANGTGAFVYNYPDSNGQISYHMRILTNMRWYNHGIGSQTSEQVRKRFFRDVFADSVIVVGAGTTVPITLRKRPQIVVIIVGINDIFNGVPIQTLQDNLEWMAASCQTIGTRAVFLNMPGDASANASQLKLIAQVNEWMSSGVLQKYDACVVDYNSWWNDPAYGYDNIHHTSLIVDNIHPSKAGYDSLSTYIFQQAKIPVLRKAIFINELSPLGFTGYSRPNNITINSDPYTITNSTDSINITTFVPDSVWIKIISSTNVTGTTYTGFSHVLWKCDNNPEDSTWFTRKALFNSGSVSPSFSSIDMMAKTNATNNLMMKIRMADGTNEILRALSGGAGGNFILNGLTNTAVLNSSVLSIYNSGGTTIGSNGNIISTGGVNQFGNLELRNNSAPTTTGYGIGTANTASSLTFYGTGSQGRDLFRFSTWNGASSNMNNASQMNLFSLVNMGFQSPVNTSAIGNSINIQPNINITGVSQSGTQIRGIRYSPVITSDSSTRHYGLFFVKGNNYLNIAGDSTCFGCDSNSFINARFRVNGSFRLDTVNTPPSTYNVLVHGLTDSLVYQIPSSTFATGNTLYTGNGSIGSDRTVSTGGFTTTWTGSNDNETSFSVANTGTTNAHAILGSATGTTSIGVSGSSTSYLGVYGLSTSNNGVQGQSSSGNGVVGVSSTGVSLRGQVNQTSTNAIENVASLLRTSSSGAGANGIGGAIQFELETTTNGLSQTAGSMAFKWTDAASATRTSQFSITGVNNTSSNTVMTVDGDGTFTTTGRRIISVDTSSAGTLTIGNAESYVFTGTTTTWTLPVVSGNMGLKYYIKNRGSGNITINSNAGGNDIYDTAATNSITVAPGAAIILINDGTYYDTQ